MICLAGGSVSVIRDGKVCFEKRDIWFDPELDLILPAPINGDVETIDCTGKYITPGFFDSHIHGCFGTDVSDCTPEDIVTMSGHLARCGISAFLPTTMTMSEDSIKSALESVSEAAGILGNMTEPHAQILGVHLEGPFLSVEQAAAQNKECLINPLEGIGLIDRLENDFPGLIKIIDIAPELEGTEEFCIRYKDRYVLSAAHSVADYDTAKRFFAIGGTSVTHMLNAMEPCLKRSPGIPGAAYETGDVYAELICDGHHISPVVLKMLFELYGGRSVVVSDAMSAAGMPDGEYDLGGAQVEVRDGRTYSKTDGRMAGSVTLVSEAAGRLYRAGISPEKIIAALTVTPYKRIKLPPPELAAGSRADINILDEDMHLVKVFSGGRKVGYT